MILFAPQSLAPAYLPEFILYHPLAWFTVLSSSQSPLCSTNAPGLLLSWGSGTSLPLPGTLHPTAPQITHLVPTSCLPRGLP